MSQDKPSGFRHSYRTIYAGFLLTGRFPKTLQHQLVHDVREDVKGPFSSITVFAWMWTAINSVYQSYDSYLIACYPFHSNSYLSQPTGDVSTNGKHTSLFLRKSYDNLSDTSQYQTICQYTTSLLADNQHRTPRAESVPSCTLQSTPHTNGALFLVKFQPQNLVRIWSPGGRVWDRAPEIASQGVRPDSVRSEVLEGSNWPSINSMNSCVARSDLQGAVWRQRKASLPSCLFIA